MSDNKTTSIVFTAHNSNEKYVKEAINSILNQSYQNFEILIMDDASDAGCALMLDSVASADRRIRVFHQDENVGVSANRNLGIENARGDYVTFVDDDDFLKQDFLEIMVSVAEDCEADIVTCNFIQKKGDLETVNPYDAECGIYSLKEELEKVAATVIDPKTDGTGMSLLMFGSAWGKIYKREFLIENSDVRFPEGMMGGEDAVFFIKALQTKVSPRLMMISDALYVYRKNDASFTVGFQPKLPEQNQTRIVKFYELSKGRPLMEKATNRNACYAIMDMCSVYLAAPECPVKNQRRFLKDILSRPEYKRALDALPNLGYDFGKKMIYTFAKLGILTPVLIAGKIYRNRK